MAALIVVLAFFLFVMPSGGGRWGGLCGMMLGYGGGVMGGFGWLFMLVVFMAVVLLIVWLVKQVQTMDSKR